MYHKQAESWAATGIPCPGSGSGGRDSESRRCELRVQVDTRNRTELKKTPSESLVASKALSFAVPHHGFAAIAVSTHAWIDSKLINTMPCPGTTRPTGKKGGEGGH